MNGEAGSHTVSAEPLEQVAAGQQGGMEIEPGGAPPGALADVAIEGDQKGGTAVTLDHSRGDDANDAGVPAVAHQDKPGIALRVGGTLDLLQRLVQHALVQRLALDVESLEPLGQRRGLDRIVTQQQTEPIGGVRHPAGGVEPGTQDETQVAGDDLLAGEPGGFDQGSEPEPAAVGQQLEAVPHQDPVFSLQRHHVGHGGERHQVQQMEWKVRRQAERRHQCLHQLEGDAGSAEAVGARAVVGPLRVYHRLRRRQLGAWQVVIGDHDADAGLARGRARCRPP